MYAFESVKSRIENLTGLAQPTAREIKKRIKRSKPRAKRFKDNNLIPNNPVLPLIHYRKVVLLAGLSDPAALFERLFKTNGWIDAWRNGIYDYVHYHPGLMKCSVWREAVRVFVSGATKGKHYNSAPAMSLSCRRALDTRP